MFCDGRGPAGGLGVGRGGGWRVAAQLVQVPAHGVPAVPLPEFGTPLFLSRRTVEYHLHKVFAKLGISSRKLHRVLGKSNRPQPAPRSRAGVPAPQLGVATVVARSDPALPSIFLQPWTRRLLIAAAAGELVVDKLPAAPSRLEPLGVAARLASWGRWPPASSHRTRQAPLLPAAAIGASSAAVAARLGHDMRARLAQYAPDLAIAVGEDILRARPGRRRHLTLSPLPSGGLGTRTRQLSDETARERGHRVPNPNLTTPRSQDGSRRHNRHRRREPRSCTSRSSPRSFPGLQADPQLKGPPGGGPMFGLDQTIAETSDGASI